MIKTAAQIMTTDVVTIRPQASIQEAIEALLDNRISGLPVTDDDGQLVGVITEFAVLSMAFNYHVQNQTVAQHMSKNVITVDISQPANGIAALFMVHRVRRFPVTEGGRLVGLVSRRDVLRALNEAERPACIA